MRGRGNRHLVGHIHTVGGARVSSPIVTFDRNPAGAATVTGRVYQLMGEPAHQVLATATLHAWLRKQELLPDDAIDVTGEYWPAYNNGE